MKKFVINLIPVVAGIVLAIVISILCTTGGADSSAGETTLPSNGTDTDPIIVTNPSETQPVYEITTVPETKPVPVLPPETEVTEGVVVEEPPKEEISSEFDYIPMSQSLKNHVKLVSSFYGFEEKLIYQIIYRESSFNPRARNGYCVGLMQINTKYSEKYLTANDGLPFEINEDSDVYDPYVNIVLGIRVLDDWRRMGSKRGNTELNDWLCYYNMGWSYEKKGSNGYDRKVLGTNLESIDFSRYKIIG